MNAYLVTAKDVDIVQEYIDYWARRETGNIASLVFAETRGKAKSTFAQKHRMNIEFTNISSCVWIAEGVDRDRGIADDNDPLWEHCP